MGVDVAETTRGSPPTPQTPTNEHTRPLAPQTTVRSTRELHQAHELDLRREEKEASPMPAARTRASRQRRLRDWIDREDTNDTTDDIHLQGQEDGTEIPLSSQESWQQQNEETPMTDDYSDGSHVDSNASTMTLVIAASST